MYVYFVLSTPLCVVQHNSLYFISNFFTRKYVTPSVIRNIMKGYVMEPPK